MKYPEIQNLFGTPLSHLPKPNLPFKLKTWHIPVILLTLGIFAYGIYAAHRDIKKTRFKEKRNIKPADKEKE
jgi:hypothetical protein